MSKRLSLKHVITFVLILFYQIGLPARSFNQLMTDNVICHPSVISVFQDKLGRIWFGTKGGISIFDGSHLENIYEFNAVSGDTAYTFQSGVKDFTEDKDGNLFFRSGKDIIKYSFENSSFNQISDIHFNALGGRNGKLYGISDGNIYVWDYASGAFVLSESVDIPAAKVLFVDSESNLWFGTSNGLFRSGGNNCTEVLKNEHVVHMCESRSKEIWIATKSNGVYRITPDSLFHYTTDNSREAGFQSNRIRQIYQDRLGHIWLATYDGLCEYNPEEERFYTYSRGNQSHSLTHSSIYSVYEDNEGTLWIGTYFGGVNYTSIHREEIRYYPSGEDKRTLSSPVVGKMIEDKDGKVWICTEGGGLNVFDTQKSEFRKFTASDRKSFLPANNLKSIFSDSAKNEIYVGSHLDGLFRYNKERGDFTQVLSEQERRKIRIIDDFYICHDKTILISKQSIYVKSAGEPLALVYKSDGKKILTYLDSAGRLWITTGESLGYLSVENYLIKWFNWPKYAIKSSIICMNENVAGELILGTQGNGVLLFDPESSDLKRLSDPQDHDRICYNVIQTPSGNYLYTGEKNLSLLDKSGHILKIYRLGRDIPLNSFTSNCGLYAASDSNIYIGATNGLLVLSEKKDSLKSENLYFSKLSVSDNEWMHVNNQKEVRLKPGMQKFSFAFASDVFIKSFNASHYEYKLKGYHSRWIVATDSRVELSDIPYGHYQLCVRNRFGQLDSNGAVIDVILPAPWYETVYFRGAVILLILLIAIVLIRITRRQQHMKRDILRARLEKEHIHRLNEDKLNFFTYISHELKTPLTLIMAQTDLLSQRKDSNGYYKRQVNNLKKQCRQLENLLFELIDFRKFDQNSAELHLVTIPLNDFVKNIYYSFDVLAKKNDVDFQIELPEETICTGIDTCEMTKVLNNLLVNAFKYTEEGGRIVLKLSAADGDYVSLKICDDGKGIKEEDQSRLFDKYYSADRSSAKLYHSGIGLHLVKKIVECHGGSISVKSKEGEGTEFEIRIPYLPADDCCQTYDEADIRNTDLYLPEETEAIELPDRNVTRDSGGRVLIIEDNRDLRHLLKLVLHPFFEIEMAADGEEGLNKIEQFNPDIIISDLLMPNMNGDELCERVKKDPKYKHILFILLTGVRTDSEIVAAYQKGIDDYIFKPFNNEILLAKCLKLLENKKEYIQNKEITSPNFMITNTCDNEFVVRTEEIISLNFTRPGFEINEIAKQLCMSRTAFYNKFKELYACTPNEYISKKRMDMAIELLRSELKLSVNEISERAGFSSPTYFCRKFKDCFGVSPTHYKE